MTLKALKLSGIVLLTMWITPTLGAQWEEHLITTADTKMLQVGDRTVIAYFGAGAGLVMSGDQRAPLGSYECAGMIDAGGDGLSLYIDCVITDPNEDEVYLRVTREKSDTHAPDTGEYQYVGGTGAWEGFTAQCTYEVSYMPSKVHGVEIGVRLFIAMGAWTPNLLSVTLNWRNSAGHFMRLRCNSRRSRR